MHTFVPESLSGKGPATLLTKTTLEYARSKGKKVDPACSYAAFFIEQHPEFADLVITR